MILRYAYIYTLYDTYIYIYIYLFHRWLRSGRCHHLSGPGREGHLTSVRSALATSVRKLNMMYHIYIYIYTHTYIHTYTQHTTTVMHNVTHHAPFNI